MNPENIYFHSREVFERPDTGEMAKEKLLYLAQDEAEEENKIREAAKEHKVFLTELNSKISESGSCAKLKASEATEGGVIFLSIDKNKSIQELIEEGAYDSVEKVYLDELNESEGVEAGNNLEVAFMNLGYVTGYQEAEKELDKLNLRSVTVAELLAIGAKFPNLRGTFVSVDKLFGGWPEVLCLILHGGNHGTGPKRRVDFKFPDEMGHSTFPAVRKSKSQETQGSKTREEFDALTEEGKRLADERVQAEEIEKITKNIEQRIAEISRVAENKK